MREWFALVARLVTGGVWVYAGAVKLPDPYLSVTSVRAYDLLPEAIVPTVGYLLPVLELVIGLTLLLGLLTRGSAVVSSLLLVAFIIGIASVWARGMSIDCGCFGTGGYDPDAASQYPWEIARDSGLLLLSVFLVATSSSRWSLDSLLFRAPGARRHPDLNPHSGHDPDSDLEEAR